MSFCADLIAAQIDDSVKTDIVRRAYAVAAAIAVCNTFDTFCSVAVVNAFQTVRTAGQFARRFACAVGLCNAQFTGIAFGRAA